MENQRVIFRKYIDRAVQELDHKVLKALTKIDSRLSSMTLLEIGKQLTKEDEWKKISKGLRPKWYEFWKWRW